MKNKLLFTALLFFTLAFNAQNNSIDFDGVDDFITLNGSSNYNSLNSQTLEAWIKADQWKPNFWEGTIFGRDDASTAGFVLRAGANGTLDFTVGTNAGWVSATTTPIMLENIWYHIAAVIDNNELRIYINGSLEATTTFTLVNPTTNDILIGESAGFSGRTFDGSIDEVRIWDTPLSQSQIADNMTTDYPAGTANLIAYYKFDVLNDSDTTTPNEYDTATNGTLSNFSGTPLDAGYFTSDIDLSLSLVNAPDAITVFNNDSKAKITVTNDGAQAVSSFDVSYSIDGGSSFVTETVSQTLNPNESYVHIFDAEIPKALADFDLIATVSIVDDLNTNNDTLTVAYTSPIGSNGQFEIPLFVDEQHNFGSAGQRNFTTVALPDSNINFSKITLEISVNCPSTGCDPWDQPAKLSVVREGQSFEIARYIVPFGIACGEWTVDVTDFKTILTGATTFDSFIQVWGPSGWLLDATLIYETEEVENKYQKFTPLWTTDYHVYGDPGISHDLEEQTVTVNPNSQDVSMRMTITGHGQGNTNNAAEFAQFTHQITANGAVVNNHTLWNTECATNPCSPQNGTWIFPRAGWCPGAAVEPYWVDMTNNVVDNNISLDYVLADYTNFINTGYNGGSHTEPHFRIHSYLVEKSNQYIADNSFIDLAAVAITSPTNETINAASLVTVTLENLGSTPIINPSLTLSIDGVEVSTEIVSETIAPGSSIDYTFSYVANFDPALPYDIKTRIDVVDDEAVSNDIVSRLVDSSLSNGSVELTGITLFPNPTNGEFTISGAELNGKVQLHIYSVTGLKIYDQEIDANGSITLSNVASTGLYFVEIIKEKKVSVNKLIIK